MILDRKKPISVLKLVHTFNHTQTNRYCDIHIDHADFIKPLKYKLNRGIYNLNAGLYKIKINDTEYIIDVYFDLKDGDYLIIRSEYNIGIYMAGSTRYNVIPYKIHSTKDIKTSCNINTVNGGLDAIVIGGTTVADNNPSINNPSKIDRLSNIVINTESGNNFDSYTIDFKHQLGRLPDGARDYIIINTDQLIAHNIINTSKEILSAGLNWTYQEDFTSADYYVFFAEYNKVKKSDSNGSIRCSHFKSVTCERLLNKANKNNCIAVSNDNYNNGIWLKISKTDLEIRKPKEANAAIKKFILEKASSENPIYIEYQLDKTDYNTLLIDDYNINTWFNNTKISINNEYGISVFYKSL